MAEKDIWYVLDTTKTVAIGGQRFYHHPTLGKCYARVIGIPGNRTPEQRDANLNVVSGGQVVELVRIYPNDGSSPYNAEVVLSDDRKVGCTTLANDGDLTDAANTAQPRPEPVVEETTDEAPAQEQQQQEFDPADKNQDGVVSNKERKQYDRENQ